PSSKFFPFLVKMKTNPRSLGVALAGLVFLIGPNSVWGALTITDNFDDPSDSTFWEAIIIGTGPSAVRQNGRVEMSVPGNSQGSGGTIGIAYHSQQVVVGDFDMHVDFSLLDWPPDSGVRSGIGVNVFGTAAVERTSL